MHVFPPPGSINFQAGLQGSKNQKNYSQASKTPEVEPQTFKTPDVKVGFSISFYRAPDCEITRGPDFHSNIGAQSGLKRAPTKHEMLDLGAQQTFEMGFPKSYPN